MHALRGTPCWFQALIAARSRSFRAGRGAPPSSCHDPTLRQPVTALAHCQGCDDVVFAVDAEPGWFALVHLTWRREQEPLPWPTTERLSGSMSRALHAHTH